MKTVLAGLALLAGLTACNTNRDQESARVTADTTVTPVQTQDTTIVKKEVKTDVDVDTTHKTGDVNRDSVRH